MPLFITGISLTPFYGLIDPICQFPLLYCNPLPEDKFLALSKLRVVAANILNVIQNIFVCERVENIVGKGENAGYLQFFFIYPHCFPSALS